MLTLSKQRIFVPLLLAGFLVFGAAAAEAHDGRSGDRVAKGAVVGAAVGALVQLVQGNTEGHELLRGAVVGGAVGAAAGAIDNARRDRYGRWYGDDRYRDGYYDQGAYDQGGSYQDGYYQGGSYQGGAYRDGYAREGYSRGYGSDRTYGGNRYDHRTSHRHGSRCGHH